LQRQARLLNNQLTAADLRYYRATLTTYRGRQQSLWDAAGLTAVGRAGRPGQPARPVRLSDDQIKLLGRIAIPDVGGHSRHIAGGHNRFSFTLRDGEPRRIFNAVIPDYERRVKRLILARQPLSRGISPEAARALANGLHSAPDANRKAAGHGSREMIALVSVHFNGVLPGRTVDAVLRGDRAEAYFEIVYRTNRRRSGGVADRRNHEGAFILPRRWTDEDYDRFVGMKRRHAREINAYESHPGLAMLMRQGISRHGSLRRLRGGRIAPGRQPRLSKFFPGQSRDIDAILFGANNPDNTFRRQFTIGALEGLSPGGGPVRRAAALPRTPEARRAFIAKLTAGVRAGRPATQAERDAFKAYVLGGFADEQLRRGAKQSLEKLRPIAEADGDARAFGHLQRGINDLARRERAGRLPKPPLPAASATARTAAGGASDAADIAPPRPLGPIPRLKVDGVFGPKTRRGLLAAAANAGPRAVEQAARLARFEEFAKQVKTTGSAAGLGEAARASFAQLFGEGRNEGAALQGTINEIDGFTGGTGDVLAEDGAVGPKTGAAFAETMSFADPADFTDEFAWNHGWL